LSRLQPTTRAAAPATAGPALSPAAAPTTAPPARKTRLAEVTLAPLPVQPRRWMILSLLLVSDTLMLVAAMLAAVYGRLALGAVYSPSLYLELWPVVGLFLAGYAVWHLYPAMPLSPAVELQRMTVVTTLGYMALGTATFMFKEGMTYSRGVLLMGYVLSLVLIPGARAAIRMLLANKAWWGHPVVLLGGGPRTESIIRTLRWQPEIGLKPVGVLDDAAMPGQRVEGVPVLGPLAAMRPLTRRHPVSYAIVNVPRLGGERLETMMCGFSRHFRHLLMVPQLAGFASLWVSAVDLGGTVGLEVRHRLLDPGKRAVKRLMDLLLVFAAAPVLLPLVGLIALAVRLDSAGSVFYSQTRIGRRGRHFTAWKFRSMVQHADAVLDQYLAEHPELAEEWHRTQKLKDDPRITRMGKLLRRTSLDELPQLWNVVRGQMSLVGPRPIIDEEVPKYGRQFELFKQVRPGITGVWQTAGRNNLTYDERVRMDAYYVRNWSIWLDIHLLSRTVLAVLLGRGAY